MNTHIRCITESGTSHNDVVHNCQLCISVHLDFYTFYIISILIITTSRTQNDCEHYSIVSQRPEADHSLSVIQLYYSCKSSTSLKGPADR